MRGGDENGADEIIDCYLNGCAYRDEIYNITLFSLSPEYFF